MITTCADWYSGDDDITRGCKGKPDFTDVFSFTPVQLHVTDPEDTDFKLYRNVFCALCNHHDQIQVLQSLLPWSYGVLRNTIISVEPPSSAGMPRSCYVIPESLDCEYHHDQIKMDCESRYAPVYVNGRSYRNINCAVCDGVYPENTRVQLALPLIADRSDDSCFPRSAKPG